jgi:Zn-dependent peptidase ImmA (M78 family)
MVNHSKELQEARESAENILKNYSLTAPPVPVESIIEDFDLTLSFIDLKEKSDEISGLFDPKSKTIFVNVKDSPQRQRFTIAHELGHALLHADKLNDDPDLGIFYRKSMEGINLSGKYMIEEKQANHFAAHLLMPENLLKKFSLLCNGSLFSLAEIFNVSPQALTHHLRNLKMTGIFNEF